MRPRDGAEIGASRCDDRVGVIRLRDRADRDGRDMQMIAGDLDAVTASMAKYWCSDKQVETVDECLQLHGGYGYMRWKWRAAQA